MCSMYCRHCTRRRHVGSHEQAIPQAEIDAAHRAGDLHRGAPERERDARDDGRHQHDDGDDFWAPAIDGSIIHEFSYMCAASYVRYHHPMDAQNATTSRQWTFLTNHGHVLIHVHRNPDARISEIARAVGITERAVQAILHDLAEAGYVTRQRVGRRNSYRLDDDLRLRHPLEADHPVGDLLAVFAE